MGHKEKRLRGREITYLIIISGCAKNSEYSSSNDLFSKMKIGITKRVRSMPILICDIILNTIILLDERTPEMKQIMRIAIVHVHYLPATSKFINSKQDIYYQDTHGCVHYDYKNWLHLRLCP